MPRRIPRSALLIPGLGLFFALLFSLQTRLRAYALGNEFRLGDIAVESLSRWLLYAAFAPAVGALVARLPIERGRIARRLPIHVLGGLLFAVLHSVCVGLIYRALPVYPRQDSLGEAIGRLLLVYFGVNLVVFWTISGVYHAVRYHHEVRNREQLAAALRSRLAQARLDNLRAQLNPHFLFNTLNAASTLALTGEHDQVVKTLSGLSDLLRVSLDPHLPQEIPLDQELGILEGYLEIQRIRFGDRLAVTPDIADDTRDALLPSMLLQPLVENALQHGIEARPGPGRVSVATRLKDGSLCVRIEDSGPGFRAAAPTPARNGIGLSNTRARLAELYGDAQSLDCGNLPGGGAYVEVVLPFRTASSNGGGR